MDIEVIFILTGLMVKLLNRDFTCTRYDSDIKSNRQTNLEQKRIVPLYHY